MPNMATHARAKLRRVRRTGPQPSKVALEAVKGFLATARYAGPGNDPAPLAPQPVDLTAFARHLFNERRLRDQLLGAELFHDPVWDVLLELYASAGEKRQVTVTGACAASGAPSTSALRYVKMMTKEGLIVRDECRSDARRVYVRLSDKANQMMMDLLSRMTRDRLTFGLAGR